jgi:uncharacterized protein (DUF4415 family)
MKTMNKNRASASSQREKQRRRSAASTRKAASPATGRRLTAKQKRDLAALAALPDDRVDTSDIPELPLSAWNDAVRGRFYRPVKQAVSLRLDADIVEWLKRPGRGYQTRANALLRQHMLADPRKA